MQIAAICKMSHYIICYSNEMPNGKDCKFSSQTLALAQIAFDINRKNFEVPAFQKLLVKGFVRVHIEKISLEKIA